MKQLLCILVLFVLCSFKSKGQNIDQYQKLYLAEELGFQPDSIQNPEIYNTVVEWLSTHYKYGGRTEKGIDCSSFAKVVYEKAFHLSLSGSSGSIFESDVFPIAKEELREGDLLFFKIRRKRISHVGVYLGKNKFAHATHGAGVTISDLDEPYYRKYFFKAGRHKSFSTIVSSNE